MDGGIWLKLPKSLCSSVSAPRPFFKMALPMKAMKVMKAMKAMKAATSMKAKVMKKKAVSKIARGLWVGFVEFCRVLSGFCRGSVGDLMIWVLRTWERYGFNECQC